MCKKNAYYYLNSNTTSESTASVPEGTTLPHTPSFHKGGRRGVLVAPYPESVLFYCKKHAIETKILVDDGKNKPKQSTKSKQKQKQPYLSLIIPSKPKQQNACDVDMIILGRNLKNKFDLIFNEYASSENELYIDAVVIENQIGPLAGRMKMLQGMIAQYFIMKNVEKIEFISATNKLKLFKNIKNIKNNENNNNENNNNKINDNENNNNKINDNSYKFRKQQGQRICKSLVSFYPSLHSWNQEFDKHSKKDDLADCFLQGYYYMYSNSVYQNMFAFNLDLFMLLKN